MNKKYSVILALLIVGIIFSIYTILDVYSGDNSRITKILSKVIDGDTIKLDDGSTVRLLNVNSPEKGAIGSELSTQFLKSFENKPISLEFLGTDKYNRKLARIYTSEYINLELINRGFASKFLVQQSELSLFADAEERAIKNSLGIWNRSSYFGCISSKIDKNAEIVLITNKCAPINFAGWFLKDESRKTYKFSIVLAGEISLHSAIGADNSTDLFWNNNGDIWNNDRDSLYLFDSKGGIVDYETYGY